MMKTESSSVDRKKGNLVQAEKMIRKKCCRRRAKRCAPAIMPTVVQKVYEVCRQVFKGPAAVPLPQDVQRLQLILDKMKPEDVGLSGALPFFKANSTPKRNPIILYTTVYKCDDFSMCIFLLPPSAVIPLHNHPGMTVFSKLLLGTMHIKAYDWADPTESNDPKPSSYLRLARLEVDRTFTAPCDASILYPSSGGNMHAFTAVTPCAVLDVLGPPYSKEDDRDCTYYRDFPCSHILDGAAAEGKDVDNSYGWLEEIEMPEELRLGFVEYRGPRVVESCAF